jgi:hypothetical protein
VLGQKRYWAQYEAGKVGKGVHSKSGKDLPVGRPRRIFNHERVSNYGNSTRAIDRLPDS